MSGATALPTALDGITADWLTGALSVRTPGTVVRSVEVESVIWGTATKVFLRAGYETCPPDGPPPALCLKGGFDDTMRAVAGIGYQVEARFYRDIAGLLGDAVPRCWYAAEDPTGNQGLLIVDDLRDAGVVFGGPSVRFDVDQVAQGLATLASVHGRTWQRRGVGSLDWLTVGSMLFRPVVESFLTPAHWDAYQELPQTGSFDDALRDRDRVDRAVHLLWAADDAAPLAVSHGDPHVGNTFVPADRVPRFLDWQTTCLAPWSDDVAYFLVGALEIEDRRKHEEDLLRHYLDALAAAGGEAPPYSEAWDAYRRHHLHGLMFALCPPEMQPAEVCRQMGDRYATAARDHGTLDLVLADA
ncbi:oxidoreductase family protein [Sporichthya polymorpha]|uniref:oxidoreductase family protein n=1 Tax=Sporichthya polymorpha TaxID=35751 RepID=UPI00036FF02B|nr:oxidoreductase family protein [Sporichthya polymorpha]